MPTFTEVLPILTPSAASNFTLASRPAAPPAAMSAVRKKRRREVSSLMVVLSEMGFNFCLIDNAPVDINLKWHKTPQV